MKPFLTEVLSWITFTIAAILVGWFAFHWLRRTENPVRLIVKWVVTILFGSLILWAAKNLGPYAVLVAAVCGLVVGSMWAPNLAGMLARPLTNLFDGGSEEPEPVPFYSIAEAKRKQGRYDEAVAEIRKQLAQFPEDFRGWMMLAEIQAENLNDLPAAVETVERILTHPDHAPKNIVFALNRVADWHLRFGIDPESARQALESIVERFPDTEAAQLARQRIAHLATGEQLAERHDRPRVVLRRAEDNLGLRTEPGQIQAPPEDPAEKANECIRRLEQYPEDNETRERLAMIYANHYQRLDLASMQLEELIRTPNQPPKEIVRWLNLLADIQIRLAADRAAARATLERIVELFPKTAAAENALNRIGYLNLEMRATQNRPAIKLGTYEQNLGLNSSLKK